MLWLEDIEREDNLAVVKFHVTEWAKMVCIEIDNLHKRLKAVEGLGKDTAEAPLSERYAEYTCEPGFLLAENVRLRTENVVLRNQVALAAEVCARFDYCTYPNLPDEQTMHLTKRFQKALGQLRKSVHPYPWEASRAALGEEG